MSQLAPASANGEYTRSPSAFRADRLPPVPIFREEATESEGRGENNTPRRRRPIYRLYAGKACPWAHRTMMVAALRNLVPADVLDVTLLEPGDEGLWEFVGGPGAPGAYGCETLKELYELCLSGIDRQGKSYSGRATAPLLVQVPGPEEQGPPYVVCNESADIARLLNELGRRAAIEGIGVGGAGVELYPESHREDIDTWIAELYDGLNNGVYRAGFARSQAAKDRAVADVAATLDRVESTLQTTRYLCGTESPTLADVFLFTTLFRFDAVYAPLFGCTLRRVADLGATSGFVRDLYQQNGVAATCDAEGAMRQYYTTLFPLNPSGHIPPLPPYLAPENLAEPHGRESMGQSKSPS